MTTNHTRKYRTEGNVVMYGEWRSCIAENEAEARGIARAMNQPTLSGNPEAIPDMVDVMRAVLEGEPFLKKARAALAKWERGTK